VFIRTQTNGSRTYLLLVENERVDGRLVQRVLFRFGRLEQLRASGQIDTLVQSLGRFADKMVVLDAHARGQTIPTRTVKIGPGLLFDRLWNDCGIQAVLEAELAGRRFGFDLARAVFLTVLHRLMAPGSDRAAERWKMDYELPGTESLGLHHLYRAMSWLGASLPESEQAAATPFAPRTRKDRIEEALFARRRDLFNQQLRMVFFDTTSIYFEGAGGESIGQHGHSKDHRPDLRQMIVGVVIDEDGRPVCSEMWPGNTTDVTTLVPIVERLQRAFHVQEICIVADRGMISAETMKAIEERGWFYILGVRMRSSDEARAVVDTANASDEGFVTVFPKRKKSHDPEPLQVKEVLAGENRYVVCWNEEQARKDAYDREAIVAALRSALTRGDKALVGNKGYRRYLASQGAGFAIDDATVADDARYDGLWVLRTNTNLLPRYVALAYKQLWTVEAVFRTMKSVLDTRPIYHRRDDTIRGHVFCSFLALLIRYELQQRLDEKRWKLEWAHVIEDLDALQETTITIDERAFVVRSEAKRTVGKVFQACHVALPPVLRSMDAPESPPETEAGRDTTPNPRL
jgi:transposase